MARFFPGRDFYCLTVSPTDTRLYADAMGALLTINAATGQELSSAPLPNGQPPPYLGPVTARAGASALSARISSATT